MGAKRRLLVLDINGTLLDRLSAKTAKASSSANIVHEFSVKKRKIYLRPYLDTFLTQLNSWENFDVAIWTSAKRENAQRIVDNIFDGLPDLDKPRFCWFREHWYLNIFHLLAKSTDLACLSFP